MLEHTIVNILRELGDIAHWTICPASGAGDSACPPIVRWRYTDPPADAASFFREAVRTFQGALAWEFSAAQPLWVLMPTAINQYAKAHNCKGGLQAAEALMAEEPDFGKRANAELPLLFEHIRYYYGNHVRAKDVA